MKDKIIIKSINQFNKEIIEILKPHFENYLYIKQEFDKDNINVEFKKRFCSFYKLNGPGGLHPLQKTKFFFLLSKKESDLKKILLALYKVSGYKNRQKIYLSFASKLIHTLDNNLPIYDRSVSSILCLSNPAYCVLLEKRIESKIDIYIDVYTELKKRFNLLLKNKQIKIILEKNRRLLNLPSSISDAKLLDSILWCLFKISKKIKKFNSE